MKIKLLVAAVALASSANINAAILSESITGQGEAVFSVWDPTTSQSYALDLGTTWQEFRDNLTNAAYSVSYTINTSGGSVYDQALGGSDVNNLIWNVGVAELADQVGFTNFADSGFIGTSAIGGDINTVAKNNANSAHGIYATALRGTTTPVNNDPALNDEYFGTVANGAYAGAIGTWGTDFGNPTGVITGTTGVGGDLGFYYWQDDGFGGVITNEAVGTWSFDGSTLSYGVSAVPVPAAVWLFGSGLLGLVGVARRKAANA